MNIARVISENRFGFCHDIINWLVQNNIHLDIAAFNLTYKSSYPVAYWKYLYQEYSIDPSDDLVLLSLQSGNFPVWHWLVSFLKKANPARLLMTLNQIEATPFIRILHHRCKI